MARPQTQLLTDREAQLMSVLWDRGPSTAEEVRASLPDQLHDSSVRTILRILKVKGYVSTRGRQPVKYVARVARTQAQTKATKTLLERLFGGSVEALVLRLVEDEDLTPERLARMRKLFSKRKR